MKVYCTFEVGFFPVHKSMCLKLSFLILFPMHSQALEKYNIEKETKHFIYFYLGQVAVLLFKSG